MKVFRALGKTIKWALILGALLVVAIVIAVAISLGNAASKSDKSSRQVSAAKFAQIKTGWSKTRLRALIGKPESTDFQQVAGLRMECWYYGVLSSTRSYQFCFANGKLDAKSRY
jgi:outer membrane protein assembly factor BamE (lipoprotein component of BamABCDE complex)